MLIALLSLMLMSMAVSPSVSKVGSRWKLAITGAITGVLLIVVHNTPTPPTNTVTVTQTGNGSQQVITDTTPASASGEHIVPGTGFTGDTGQPAQIGTGTAADENAIARWDVIPFQTFSGNYNVGVKAYHVNGIARVGFRAKGGEYTYVTSESLNPTTGVVEYWATLHAEDFGDEAFDVEFVAEPVAGVPRVSDRLTLNANAGGTLTSTLTSTVIKWVDYAVDSDGDGSEATPYKTIQSAITAINALAGHTDGGTIYLKAGTHYQRARGGGEYSTNLGLRWLTITHAPGVTREECILDGKTGLAGDDGGMYVQLLRFYDISLVKIPNGTPAFVDSVWFDHCNIYRGGDGRYFGPAGSLNPSDWTDFQWNYRYATDCYIHDIPSMPDGMAIYRNCTVERISGSGVHQCPLAINVVITDSDTLGNTDIHPDVLQYAGVADNVIWYNISAVAGAEPIDSFGVRLNTDARDIAIVSCNLNVSAAYVWEMGSGDPGYTQPYRHVYVKDCSLTPGYSYYYLAPTNVVFENTADSPSHEGITVR